MQAAAPSALAAAAAAAVPSASAAGWQALFSRQEAKIPLCKHGEPCKKQTVRKVGANQGRSFYSCVRAEGPRTNPDANCGYFAWSSDWEQQLRSKRKRDEMASSAGR
jgi:AP endonuclease-2